MSPDYYDRVNPDLLALIPPDAKTVLEIGCGAGALCQAYRRVNPGVDWIGVDIDSEAINAARQAGRLSNAFRFDADRAKIYDHIMGTTPDCLIFGDVLEHLQDPWGQLKYLVGGLAPGGLVLACIPNVQHWTVIRDLMAGKWEYTDEGLLDRTHLRFFTLDSIRAMFVGAGLQVVDIKGRDICNQGWADWAQQIERYFNEEDGKRMQAYQYVVRAVKPKLIEGTKSEVVIGGKAFGAGKWKAVESISPLHIHAVLAEGCCARPRIHEPFAALSTIPGVKCTTGMDGSWPSGLNVLIEQRFRHIDFGCRQLDLDAGRLVIGEIDDDPDGLYRPLRSQTLMGDPIVYKVPPGDIYGWLRSCHAVQVSTEALAERVREYNPNVMVFPNQIAELGPLREFQEFKDFAGPTIFFGAQNRESDWATIMPAINRVIHDHKNVAFRVVHDRTFFNALETPLKIYQDFLPHDQYRSILRSCDIALLPLDVSIFNWCKSDIKFLECAAEGTACIMSKAASAGVDPMCRDIRVTDMAEVWGFSDCFDTFTPRLAKLIGDATYRRELAEHAYAYVRDNRMLGQHFRKRYDWYVHLMRSKEALGRQLLERCPELRSEAFRELPTR